MKKNLLSFLRIFQLTTAGFLAIIISVAFLSQSATAQIWEPEGLNMPGAWNSWTNPPSNNLALASSTQVPGGRITKIAVGTTRWQTSFSVAATGGDLIGGSYEWLFTSGSSSNAYGNKWSNVAVAMNTLQTYTKEGANNNSVTLTDNKWYTVVWEDLGYADCHAIFMETSAQPVTISSVSVPSNVVGNTAADITVSTSVAKSAEEIIYIRYTTNAWSTSAAIPVTMTGTSGTAQIPGQPAGTIVAYYAFSSTVASLGSDYDLCTINLSNNSGLNYSYTVVAPSPSITWANLQYPPSGAIETGQAYDVYGQAFIPGITGQATVAPGLQAWVGYSTTNTDPATWTNWVSASYNTAAGNNDEFKADLGTMIPAAGTYYYATRFQLNADPYVYGGYNGGFWDGTTNVSGTLTVTDPIPDPDFDWVNLQYPGNGTIEPSQEFIVFAQAYIQGVTGQAAPAPGIQAWIGYSTSNTNPDTWTNWVPAPYSGPVGNNDEFSSDLGGQIATPGTYYYASRFQLNTGNYFYGGFSETGGGIWNGTSNVSGELEVVLPGPGIDWVNLQYPASDTIELAQDFDVYAQAYINGVTGQPAPAPGLQAWIGYNSINSDPATWTNWVPATYNFAVGNNDEFKANIGTSVSQTGVWYYASRFQLNNNDFVYGGYNLSGGGFWDGVTNVSGELTVTSPPVLYPVLFTIVDGTLNNTNIKFKGEMTNWDTVAMTRFNNIWTLTLNLLPGSYEWGAIEADGSADGIWLIDGPNLVVTVGTNGNISGTVTYTTLITDIDEHSTGIRVFPNPTAGILFLDMPTEASVRITDASGRLLLQHDLPAGNSQLNIGDYKSGMYNIEIGSGNLIRYFRIIRK